MVPDHELDIPGYTLLRKDRNRRGGGVCVYVRNSIEYKQRHDLDMENIESIWIKIELKKKIFNIGTVYRPPSSNSSYYDTILNQIEFMKNSSNEHIILMGDLNFDYLCDSSPIHFIETTYEMKQLIELPTRVTPDSSTLLDVILSSCPTDHSSTQVMDIALSDHYLISTELRLTSAIDRGRHRLVTFRDFKNFDGASFLCDLQRCDSINNIDFNHTDVQEHWACFKSDFMKLCDKHAPIKSRRLKPRFNPWIDSSIIRDMYKRDHIKSRAIVTKDPAVLNEYRRLRNVVTSRINAAKKAYYNNELKINAGKPNKIWTLINRLVKGHKNCDTPNDIAPDEFNDYFANVGLHISEKFSERNNPSNFECWKGPKSTVQFQFYPIECTSVSKCLKQLDSKNSDDILGMNSILLRLSADVIAPVLTKMFNKCLSNGSVLDDWKYARVTPVYKGKGSKSDMRNYRPISVISHVAKIFEKEVQKQLMSFLIDNNFLSIDQSAYREYHNTQTCLHRVIDDWLENIGDSLLTGVCMLDIKKCFDSIDHDLLIHKLDCYGIRGIESQLFKSYLANRKQIVKCAKNTSDERSVMVGVPQGSVLGPILFLLFVNDLTQHIHLGTANLYADDCIIYCTGSSISEVNMNLQKCIDDVCSWYQRNRLALNAEKSNGILIASKHKHQSLNEPNKLNILIDEHNINHVKNCVYLGVNINENLSWDSQIDNVCSMLTRKVGMLSRLRKSTPNEIMLKIYMSTVQPSIDYAISIWGNTTSSNLDRVQRIQNYAARVLTGEFDYINVRGIDIVKRLGWMNVRQRFYYFNVLLIFKCIHGLAPFYLCNNVLMECEMMSRSLRNYNSMNVFIPYIENSYQSKTFICTAGKLWNDLPVVLQNICDISTFKLEVKRYIHGAVL